MRKILHLGGASSQIPAIKYAVESGYKVITCDYLPDNPGHKYSHEYYNVSTTNIEKVFQLAQSLNIDGIASYASDPAAPTVGYVAERLGLPGPGEKAAKILADKGLFRKMMREIGMRTPAYKLFPNPKEACKYLKHQNKSMMIKPVDSSGSKGVFRFNGTEDINALIEEAFKYSRKNEIIIEEYISSDSTQIQGEGFVIEGSVVFTIFGDQKLSEFNPTVPASTSLPSRHSRENLKLFQEMVIKAIQGSGFQNGGLNIEIIQDIEGHFHLLELGPRNGGNFMPQLVKRSTGVNLVHLCIDNAMGKEIETITSKHVLPHTQLILHSSKSGRYRSLSYNQNIANHIVEEYIYKNVGDEIHAYRGSQDVIGVLILDVQGIGSPKERNLSIEDHIDLRIDEEGIYI